MFLSNCSVIEIADWACNSNLDIGNAGLCLFSPDGRRGKKTIRHRFYEGDGMEKRFTCTRRSIPVVTDFSVHVQTPTLGSSILENCEALRTPFRSLGHRQAPRCGSHLLFRSDCVYEQEECEIA